ncbi:hypothetical protein FOA52_011624 [Chlamydomonas sp. UWO 241]|nr:hypothetical protein FOA52_011624 [Chlamydomonas sp. UWO 241]
MQPVAGSMLDASLVVTGKQPDSRRATGTQQARMHAAGECNDATPAQSPSSPRQYLNQQQQRQHQQWSLRGSGYAARMRMGSTPLTDAPSLLLPCIIPRPAQPTHYHLSSDDLTALNVSPGQPSLSELEARIEASIEQLEASLQADALEMEMVTARAASRAAMRESAASMGAVYALGAGVGAGAAAVGGASAEGAPHNARASYGGEYAGGWGMRSPLRGSSASSASARATAAMCRSADGTAASGGGTARRSPGPPRVARSLSSHPLQHRLPSPSALPRPQWETRPGGSAGAMWAHQQQQQQQRVSRSVSPGPRAARTPQHGLREQQQQRARRSVSPGMPVHAAAAAAARMAGGVHQQHHYPPQQQRCHAASPGEPANRASLSLASPRLPPHTAAAGPRRSTSPGPGPRWGPPLSPPAPRAVDLAAFVAAPLPRVAQLAHASRSAGAVAPLGVSGSTGGSGAGAGGGGNRGGGCGAHSRLADALASTNDGDNTWSGLSLGRHDLPLHRHRASASPCGGDNSPRVPRLMSPRHADSTADMTSAARTAAAVRSAAAPASVLSHLSSVAPASVLPHSASVAGPLGDGASPRSDIFWALPLDSNAGRKAAAAASRPAAPKRPAAAGASRLASAAAAVAAFHAEATAVAVAHDGGDDGDNLFAMGRRGKLLPSAVRSTSPVASTGAGARAHRAAAAPHADSAKQLPMPARVPSHAHAHPAPEDGDIPASHSILVVDWSRDALQQYEQALQHFAEELQNTPYAAPPALLLLQSEVGGGGGAGSGVGTPRGAALSSSLRRSATAGATSATSSATRERSAAGKGSEAHAGKAQAPAAAAAAAIVPAPAMAHVSARVTLESYAAIQAAEVVLAAAAAHPPHALSPRPWEGAATGTPTRSLVSAMLQQLQHSPNGAASARSSVARFVPPDFLMCSSSSPSSCGSGGSVCAHVSATAAAAATVAPAAASGKEEGAQPWPQPAATQSPPVKMPQLVAMPPPVAMPQSVTMPQPMMQSQPVAQPQPHPMPLPQPRPVTLQPVPAAACAALATSAPAVRASPTLCSFALDIERAAEEAAAANAYRKHVGAPPPLPLPSGKLQLGKSGAVAGNREGGRVVVQVLQDGGMADAFLAAGGGYAR